MEVFEQAFNTALNDCKVSENLRNKLWQEIADTYSQVRRYYHNLSHLDNLVSKLLPFKAEITDWQLIVFAIAYHDMIYNVLNSDNEERSAKLAVARLNELGLPDSKIRKCEQYIIATKSHEASDDTDMNLFTDADLAILGSQPQQYLQYIEQIRQEYKYFPDIVYKPGRKKVLHHFLNMQTIYKTKEFAAKYEQQARANLSMEIEMLQ